ncbi:hypothetical protein PIB30_042513 [Stylosanthes scabra]|uniref:Uncharacterized protein n=1 Tax=Stylosanthes scabra TaxID=79078 RepID=A0ABU6SFL5_9FABA|nr:hypothetical protein [Stylosanthes scabra]
MEKSLNEGSKREVELQQEKQRARIRGRVLNQSSGEEQGRRSVKQGQTQHDNRTEMQRWTPEKDEVEGGSGGVEFDGGVRHCSAPPVMSRAESIEKRRMG